MATRPGSTVRAPELPGGIEWLNIPPPLGLADLTAGTVTLLRLYAPDPA